MAQFSLERLNLLRDGAIELTFKKLWLLAEPGVNIVKSL